MGSTPIVRTSSTIAMRGRCTQARIDGANLSRRCEPPHTSRSPDPPIFPSVKQTRLRTATGNPQLPAALFLPWRRVVAERYQTTRAVAERALLTDGFFGERHK